jgi:hypothetical protein
VWGSLEIVNAKNRLPLVRAEFRTVNIVIGLARGRNGGLLFGFFGRDVDADSAGGKGQVPNRPDPPTPRQGVNYPMQMPGGSS